MTEPTGLRVAVLGAGPIGLEAALRGVSLGFDVVVLEADRVGENLEEWGHVRLFSPWKMNHTSRGLQAAKAITPRGWPDPEDYLTGREYRHQYLLPLSRSTLLAGRILEEHRVVAIGRHGLLKGERIGDARRLDSRFRILTSTPQGEKILAADRVLDATGTYGSPNWLGDGGVPAPGERRSGTRISYQLDDLLGEHRDRYRGRKTLLVGDGLSAATSLQGFQRLVEEDPSTEVLWATRSGDPEPYVGFPDDPLPVRARLIAHANRIAVQGARGIHRLPGRVVEAIAPTGDQLLVTLNSAAGQENHRVDRILANVGYRPDRSLYADLQIHECYASDGPMKLAAALLGDGSADCLDQRGKGPDSLLNPEPGFFILGAKSYGRNSRFLLGVGFEQIEDVFRLLTGPPAALPAVHPSGARA